MRQRTSRPIRLAMGLATSATLVLAACGSDSDSSDSSGSTEAFCDDVLAIGDLGEDTTEEDGLAAFRTAADSAPSEISDEMNQFVDLLVRLQEFGEEPTEEDIADITEVSAELEELSLKVEEFSKENCPDLPADFFD
jgi:hypothetical protein